MHNKLFNNTNLTLNMTRICTGHGKKWKLLAPQAKKLIVIGADGLSCSWTNRKVSVNYRRSGEDQGSLVSLELE